MLDPFGERDHLLHPATRIRAGEVLVHPPPQVARRPDIEHLVAGAAEQVHPGPMRQVPGQRPLGALGGGDIGQVVAQFTEGVDALIADPLDERVQDVDGRARVVERPVGGLGGGTDQSGEGGEADAGGLLAAENPAGQAHRAQHGRPPRPGDAAALRGRPEETDVEAGVVGHQHRSAGELQEHRQHSLDRRGVAHHRGGDAREFDDLRRDVPSRVYQGGELADHLTAADLDRPDLGDRIVAAIRPRLRAAPGGLQIDDDECDLVQGGFRRREFRSVEIAEAQLSI